MSACRAVAQPGSILILECPPVSAGSGRGAAAVRASGVPGGFGRRRRRGAAGVCGGAGGRDGGPAPGAGGANARRRRRAGAGPRCVSSTSMGLFCGADLAAELIPSTCLSQHGEQHCATGSALRRLLTIVFIAAFVLVMPISCHPVMRADRARAAPQEHAEEHLNAVNGLVSFADARLADMQALYVVVEERLQGMAAAQECAPLPSSGFCAREGLHSAMNVAIPAAWHRRRAVALAKGSSGCDTCLDELGQTAVPTDGSLLWQARRR